VPQDPEQALRELEASVLFAPDFPKRVNYTHDEQQRLSQSEIEAWRRPKREAIERARANYKHLCGLVVALGKARYTPAVPTLARLWRECALVPVRGAVGPALFQMQSEQAWAALEAMIEDVDADSVLWGVRVIFERDPAKAYDTFEPLFREDRTGAHVIAKKALSTFAPVGWRVKDGRRVLSWTNPCAPDWLKQDVRWLDLSACLRRDGTFGGVAREVLRNADPEDRAAALTRARAIEPPVRIDIRRARDGQLLARYRSGEFEAVWREMRSFSHIGGEYREEVSDVAQETMRRVARNADRIAERLQAAGWKALTGQLRTPPSPSDLEVFGRIASMAGSPVPPSLQAFWTLVGGIDWVWNYKLDEASPDLGVAVPVIDQDPLYVDPPSVVDHVFAYWEDQRDQSDPDLVDPFALDLAPDFYHKANISGGPAYGIELPFFGADPPFVNERHHLTFVDYLRLCFRWAGFPGLEDHSEREDVRRFIAEFGRDLEPF
jgi:hypothetical protein